MHDGKAGVRYGETGTYDVIILDVMLPKADGFTVAQRLRRAHVSTPILLLTARDAISDKICGYDSGRKRLHIRGWKLSTMPFAARSLFGSRACWVVFERERFSDDRADSVVHHRVQRECFRSNDAGFCLPSER